MKKRELYVLASILFSIGLLVYVGKYLTHIHKIYNVDSRSAHFLENENHQALQQAPSTYIPDNSVHPSSNKDSGQNLSHENTETQRNKIEDLNEKVSSISEEILRVDKKLSELSILQDTYRRDAAIMLDMVADHQVNQGANPESVSFSLYLTPEWVGQVSDFSSKAGTLSPSFRAVDAREGIDTINIASDKNFMINGIETRNIEMYDFLNGLPNQIFVTAPGLAFLGQNSMQITADKDLDKVFLDGCLVWDLSFHGPNILGYITWIAVDSKGAVRKLRISNDVKTVINPECDSQYIFEAKKDLLEDLATIDIYASRKQQGTKPDDLRINQVKTQTVPQVPTVSYESRDREYLHHYKYWISMIDHKQIAYDLALMTELMEQMRLPTEFPQFDPHTDRYILKPLLFSPMRRSSRVLFPGFDCSKIDSDKDRDSAFIVSTDGNGYAVECNSQNNMYFTSDARDKITDLNGDNIFSTGSGDDYVDAGRGQDIVILRRGWGNQTLKKDCSLADPGNKSLFRISVKQGNIVGIGVAFGVVPQGLFIKDVIANEPAMRAGLVKGDLILEVDGVTVLGMSQQQAINALRGVAGSKVSLKYRKYNTSEIADITLLREGIEAASSIHSSSTARLLDYKWPYDYINFIIFGPGIKPQDLGWEGKNIIVNRNNGDRLTLQGTCYNFVFVDGGTMSPL